MADTSLSRPSKSYTADEAIDLHSVNSDAGLSQRSGQVSALRVFCLVGIASTAAL